MSDTGSPAGTRRLYEVVQALAEQGATRISQHRGGLDWVEGESSVSYKHQGVIHLRSRDAERPHLLPAHFSTDHAAGVDGPLVIQNSIIGEFDSKVRTPSNEETDHQQSEQEGEDADEC